MFSKTMTNRMKAAAVAALMCLSVAATSMSVMTASLMDVEAVSVGESIEVDEKVVFKLSELGVSELTSITVTGTSSVTGTLAYGAGISTTVAPDYWAELPEGSVKITAGSTFTVTFDLSDVSASTTGEFQFRNYWSEGGSVTIDSITANGGSSTTDPTDPDDDPDTGSNTDGSTTKNDKNGTWSFTDNGDGTGTMVATQAREHECNWHLTKGYDEDYYMAEGITPVEGEDPINSHKFTYNGEFGLTGVGNIKGETGIYVQSLEATITSDVALKRFMYGGGLNVGPDSPADTEAAKVAAGYKESGGYWYNDMGEDVYEECLEAGVEFGVTPAFGYDLTSEDSQLGEYFSVIWDVPQEVIPYEDSGTLSFQFWYAEEDAEQYTEATEVDLISGILTYTETKTFDFTDRVSYDIGAELSAAEGNMEGFKISDIEQLGENAEVKAVVFTLDSAADLDKMVYAVGASVGEGWQQWSDTEGGDAWQYVLTDTKAGKVEIAWIVPDGVDINEQYGDIKLGYWYGGMGETSQETVTLESVEVFYFEDEVETTEPTTEAPTEPPTDAPTEPPTEELKASLYGDVDCNEKVEILDVIALSKSLMGNGKLSEQGALNADVDVNGAINTTDALNIMKYLVKLIEELPV